MRNANSSNESTELTDVLKAWQPPNVPASLDQHILASYRQQMNRVPFWRRFFTTSIPVPLPIIAIQAMLFLVATGAVIAFFQERDHQAAPLAQQQVTTESALSVEQPNLQSTRTIEKKRIRLRMPKVHAATVTLPSSTVIRPKVETTSQFMSTVLTPEVQTAGQAIPPDSLLISTIATPEHKLAFTPTLNFKVKFPDPLKVDFAHTTASEFVFEGPLEKGGLFDGRISRTITRAGNLVSKPLEKGIELYRIVPRTIPTINSFITPAKDACLAPFRSTPVNVQIN
ncbi:MAG: hypothetical protein JST84_13340 [Acidobacteria bacterium]|nr:hypothetical protein [Acidobacteriota bacterium]